MKQTTTTRLFVKDRDYIERLKRKNQFKTNEETIESMCKVIRTHKFEEELK